MPNMHVPHNNARTLENQIADLEMSAATKGTPCKCDCRACGMMGAHNTSKCKGKCARQMKVK